MHSLFVPARLRPWLASVQMKRVQPSPPQKKTVRNTDALTGVVAPAFAISAPPTAANHKIALGDETASSAPRRKLLAWPGRGVARSASPSTGGADAG